MYSSTDRSGSSLWRANLLRRGALLFCGAALVGCADAQAQSANGSSDAQATARATSSRGEPEAPPNAAKCSYYSADGAGYDGACVVTFYGDELVVTWAGFDLVWREEDRMSVWARGSLNGQPAMRYEENRYIAAYVTQDLKQSLYLDESAR
jgi:hypothetical protein